MKECVTDDCECISANGNNNGSRVPWHLGEVGEQTMGGKLVRFNSRIDVLENVDGCTPACQCLNLLTVKPASAISTVVEPEWQEIEITVDSGACDTVMPTSLSPQISLLQTEMSRSGMEYEVANGAGLPNMGEKRCVMMTENSTLGKRIVFQCADVHKALLSVSRCSDLGYECIMGKDGGELRDLMTGDRIPLHRRNNLYYLRAWIKQDNGTPAAGFARQESQR